MSAVASMNHLFYGDNLDILRRYVEDESIDLVYLDPPFKSNQDYNILFREQDGAKAAAQILAFEDTWEWNTAAAAACEQIIEAGGRTSEAMQAFRTFLGPSDMMAYLAMMAPRLVELRRVLKSTGSIYLHCDPAASHYLKMLLDAVFGAQNFRNEIIWKRTSGHSDARGHGQVHDTILFYTASDEYKWNPVFQPYERSYVQQYYRYKDKDGRRFMSGDIGAAGLQGGGYKYEWKGITRVWRCPIETMQRLDLEGRLFYTRNGIPRMKRYLDESKGMPAQDVWCDIEALRSWHAAERLGYPTQKPQALLERVITASSNEGDTVLDPFCGCGTAVEAAQKLNRAWVGIDITHLATALIKHRLQTAFGDAIQGTYKVTGEPVSLPDAQALARENPFQFQCWALSLVGARPTEQKKGADRGIDGRLFFHDDKTGEPKQIIFSVKSGEHLTPAFVRDLRGVVHREQAQIGILITLARPTSEMRRECASAGLYKSSWGQHPVLQILTIEELLEGVGVDRPPTREADTTFRKRVRSIGRPAQQMRLRGTS